MLLCGTIPLASPIGLLDLCLDHFHLIYYVLSIETVCSYMYVKMLDCIHNGCLCTLYLCAQTKYQMHAGFARSTTKQTTSSTSNQIALHAHVHLHLVMVM